MKRSLLILALGVSCWSIPASDRAQAWGWYDGSPGAPWWEFDTSLPGGVQYIQRPGMTICSVGGIFTPRKVTVTETDGPVPVTTTFLYPSAFHTPNSQLNLNYGRGVLKIQLPDPHGLLYVNGNRTPLRGPVQVMKTPLLQAGNAQVYQLRGVFRSGEKLLIQDKTISVPAGQVTAFVFDGTRAVAVALPSEQPKAGVETAPPPRRLPAP